MINAAVSAKPTSPEESEEQVVLDSDRIGNLDHSERLMADVLSEHPTISSAKIYANHESVEFRNTSDGLEVLHECHLDIQPWENAVKISAKGVARVAGRRFKNSWRRENAMRKRIVETAKNTHTPPT